MAASKELAVAPSVVPSPEAEIRIGLVLYGGVSLAIYIYGVVIEFWRLVRASRGLERSAYSALLEMVKRSAAVDVISGASAGGINGVLLAKALAAGGDLGSIRSLWVDSAAIDELLQPSSNSEPASLLRSQHFEEMLREALAHMDRAGSKHALVEVLDLFVPGTRVRAALYQFRDDFGQVLEAKQFRKIFHLKFRRRGYNPADPALGYDLNHFGPDQNETLVEIARATSAFPAAFEPEQITRNARNAHLFDEEDPCSSWFSDGGILHNRPFTEAISTIFTRANDRPVARWLLSVEPDPEHYRAPNPDAPEPEVLEVVSRALFGIPRYESIIGDLERLRGHRERAAAARDLLDRLDRVATYTAGGIAQMDDQEFEQYLLAQALYFVWLQMRPDQTLETFTGWISEAASLGPDSRVLVEDDLRDRLAEQLLLDSDPAFELRRILYLVGLVDRRLSALPASDRGALPALAQRLWAQFDRIQELVWLLFWSESDTARAVRSLRGASEQTVGAVLDQVVPALVTAFAVELSEVRAEVDAVAEALDPWDSPIGTPFTIVAQRFRFWDMFLLPIDKLVGPERDPIRFVRISPEAATYIQKRPMDKLAGNALGHFGGFLKRGWRRNDILWGRLDAAETIVRLLCSERATQTDVLEPSIRSVQEEIVREELPGSIPPAGEPWDYKAFLENEWNVGAETLADVPMQERASLVTGGAEVVRNMLRRVSRRGPHGLQKPFKWLGAALGFTLMLVRWPATAIWGRDPAVRRIVSLAILFLGAWAVVEILLVLVFGVIASTSRLWILIGIAVAIVVLWSLLLAIGRRLR